MVNCGAGVTPSGGSQAGVLQLNFASTCQPRALRLSLLPSIYPSCPVLVYSSEKVV